MHTGSFLFTRALTPRRLKRYVKTPFIMFHLHFPGFLFPCHTPHHLKAGVYSLLKCLQVCGESVRVRGERGARDEGRGR